jgi:acetyl-CoA carboxylase beta subunit
MTYHYTPDSKPKRKTKNNHFPRRRCVVCSLQFYPTYLRQITCSAKCRKRRNTQKTLENLHHRRRKNYPAACEICGFTLTLDIHHEGKELHTLCPNHHALITRRIKSLSDLISEREANTELEKSYRLSFRHKAYPWLVRESTKEEKTSHAWDIPD